MNLLQTSTRLSLPCRPSISPRCLVLRQALSFLPSWHKELPPRSIVIKNFPPTSTISDFLALPSTGQPIQTSRRPENKTVEITYLEAGSARYVLSLATKKQGIVLDGQRLQVELAKTHRLPVEVVATIGLRAASRRISIDAVPRGYTEKKLMKEMSRFGKVDHVWIDKEFSEQRAVVTFCHLMTAVKAQKALRKEGLSVSFRKSLPTLFKKTEYQHNTIYLWFSKQIRLHNLLRDLDKLLRFSNGDPMRAQVSGKNAFLTFSDPANAEKFYEIYQHPEGVNKGWAVKDRTPRTAEVAAIKLGASRTIFIDGFKDTRVDFDRLHEDFSKFGEIFHVFADWERAHAKVVFTNIASGLKAIEDIYENRSKYSVYRGARIGFKRSTDRAPPLRPILIPNEYERNPNASVSTEPKAMYGGVSSGVVGEVDESDDGHVVEYEDSGELEWVEHRDSSSGKYRLDVSPARNEVQS